MNRDLEDIKCFQKYTRWKVIAPLNFWLSFSFYFLTLALFSCLYPLPSFLSDNKLPIGKPVCAAHKFKENKVAWKIKQTMQVLSIQGKS